jgi:hypothetical protein
VSRTCTICGHEQRHDIEVALVRRDSYRAIARRFSVSKDALGRHAREHRPEALVRAQEAKEAEPSPGPSVGRAAAREMRNMLARCFILGRMEVVAGETFILRTDEANRESIEEAKKHCLMVYSMVRETPLRAVHSRAH